MTVTRDHGIAFSGLETGRHYLAHPFGERHARLILTSTRSESTSSPHSSTPLPSRRMRWPSSRRGEFDKLTHRVRPLAYQRAHGVDPKL